MFAYIVSVKGDRLRCRGPKHVVHVPFECLWTERLGHCVGWVGYAGYVL